MQVYSCQCWGNVTWEAVWLSATLWHIIYSFNSLTGCKCNSLCINQMPCPLSTSCMSGVFHKNWITDTPMSKGRSKWPTSTQLSTKVQPCTETTHLSSINIQSHVEAIVSGHQVCPGIGLVALVTVDSGGFYSSVCAKCEVEPCIFGAGRFQSADPNWPTFLTQWMGTVVKYT